MMHNQLMVYLQHSFPQHETRLDLAFPSSLPLITIRRYFSFWKQL